MTITTNIFRFILEWMIGFWWCIYEVVANMAKMKDNERRKHENWIKCNRILIGERWHTRSINLFEYSPVWLPKFLLCSSIVNGERTLAVHVEAWTKKKSIHILLSFCVIVVRASVAMQWQHTHSRYSLPAKLMEILWAEYNYSMVHALKWRAPHIDCFWWCRSMHPMCPKL